VGENIGKQADKVADSNAEGKNYLKQGDKANEEKDAIEDDKTGKEGGEEFIGDITIEQERRAPPAETASTVLSRPAAARLFLD
jgi:hypothetical protein